MKRSARGLIVILVELVIIALILGAAMDSGNAIAVAPTAVETSFSAVKEDSAILKGEINPGDRVSKYHFEYGTADCASSSCTSVPVPEGSIPKGTLPVAVMAEATGLSAGTTYHFRLVASNSEGDDESTDKTFTTFVAQPAFGPCPNDALRLNNPMKSFIEYSSANLPDCRAYEQVSPVDKNGSNATGVIEWVRSTPAGDAFSFLTTSGMENAEGLQTQLPTWLASKGGGDWSTQGLFAPASAGQAVEILGWLPDFSEVFELARRTDSPREVALLARNSADRSLSEIVPYHTFTGEPSYAFVGASADGQTVIFESNEKLTTEAIAGKSNVYSWDFATKVLRLVSRLPDAECETAPCAPPAGAFGGAYAWMEQEDPALEGDAVTEKGGAAFGNYSQDQRVLSTDGHYAYFTAAKTGQLYVRVNPTKEQSPVSAGQCTNPALACTLHVSASKKTNGNGKGNTDAAGPRPAAFMAASADGKSTFFTSPEKLTNDANTGPEPDEVPSLARAKLDGSPASVNLEFLLQRAAGLAVSDGYLYWADPTADAIGRVELNGEAPATEIDADFIPGADNPQYVAVDSEHVYWTNATDGKDGTGTIGRAKLNGEAPATEINQGFITGASNPTGIAVDGSSEFLYWGNAGGTIPTQAIGRAKLGPSGAEGVNQAFLTPNFNATPEGIAVNATHIYAAVNELSNSYVFRYDIDGDPLSFKLYFDAPPHPGLPGTRGIALDATHVYWTRPWDKSIGQINLELEEASAEPEFIKETGEPLGLALDTGYIYWSANQEVLPNRGNDLYRFDAESGALEDLTPDPSEENGARVVGVLGTSEDGSRVYFAANGVLAAGAAEGDCRGQTFGGNLNFTGECSLYLHEEGKPLAFIARLGAGTDAANWLSFVPTPRTEKTTRVTADGATLLFSSQSQLTSYPNEGVPQLYRYRIGQGISCMSCNTTQLPPAGAPRLGSIVPAELLPFLTAATLSRNLSADGNRVFFETTEALVPGDTNGEAGCPEKGTFTFTTPICQDVYEWEASGTGSCQAGAPNGGCLYLLSTGKSQEASFFGDASLDGKEAFIFTDAKLVGQDQDQLIDVYDASVDGGLTSQNQPPKPICDSSSSCPESVPPAPPFQSPGSQSFSGTGNVKSKQGCPKGKRKVKSKGKTRCVAKKHKSKGKSHKRAATMTRRAAR